MKIGIFRTGQHPLGSDVLAELEGQYAMTRLARDKGWDAVATGQDYLSEGVRQLQLAACRIDGGGNHDIEECGGGRYWM